MRSLPLRLSLLVALATFSSSATFAATAGTAPSAETDDLSSKVDALFARWNTATSPGATCAVIKDGALVHARGYGMADLEHNEPLSLKSVFYIASTSKQFTAASIALLALDGKLSLDDDIRRHLPEMTAMAKPITVRHLVHHTSGLRDYFGLLSVTGWRDVDYFNNDFVVRLLARQRTVLFEPGSRHAYSNSNYVLMAEIVKRVSGQSLRQFADERIFRPLGMQHTHFDDDYRQIVPHRVVSYTPKPGGGWQQLLKEFDGYGDGNLLTTVEDLARWDANFTSGKVGGKPFLELIETRGRLNDGKPLEYAFGLVHGKYRGFANISHGGAFKGYRTQMMRFPDQKLTVIVLGNETSFNATNLAQRIADIYLAEKFPEPLRPAGNPPQPAKREPVKIDPARLEPLVGRYEFSNRPGFVLNITRNDNRMFAQATDQGRSEIFPQSENTFFYTVVDAQLTFHREPDGTVKRLTLHQGGDNEAQRMDVHTLSPAEMSEYVGSYVSEELDTIYRFEIENGKLVAKHLRLGPTPVEPLARNRFAAAGWNLEFIRDSAGEITAMQISNRPLGSLRFDRLKMRNGAAN